MIPMSSTSFASPPIIFYSNTREKIVTASFTITALVTQSMVPNTQLPLFQLPTGFIPPAEVACLGIVWNSLDVMQTHSIVYDNSDTPNVQFVAGSSFTLAPSDRFFAVVFFVT